MQSEIKNPCGLSHSFLPEEICFSDERQFSLMDLAPGYHVLKAGEKLGTAGVSSSTIENRIHLDSPIAKKLDLPECYLSHGQNVNLSSGRNTAGAERAANCSLPSSFDHEQGVRKNLKMESATHFLDRNKLNFMGAQYENSLFSRSMSDLFSRKLMVQSNNVSYGPSGSVAASCYEGEATIGNLLPDDDDLLSGVTNGFDCIVRANDGECTEDLDLFSTVGGLELGEDGSLQRNYVFSDVSSRNKTRILGVPTCKEHPFEEHPSRTLLVRNISSNAEDSELRMIFEQYGDIRSLYTACKDWGLVMVSYFDIRAARNALEALQDKPFQRRKLDIHFSYPKVIYCYVSPPNSCFRFFRFLSFSVIHLTYKFYRQDYCFAVYFFLDNPSEQDINLSALVVSSFDSSISDDELRKIFGIYGEIKEIHGNPHRSENKYVEFYDIRAAEAAYHALNRSNISGKQIKLEPGHPGGCKRPMQAFSSELEFDRYGLQPQYHSLPNTLTTGYSGSLLLGGAADCTSNGTLRGPCSIAGGPHSPVLDNVIQSGESSSVSNSLPSLIRVESRNQSHIGESGHLWAHLNFELHSTPNLHTHSLPEYQDSLANGPSFGSPSNMAANISSRAPKILDNQQFCRIISTVQSSELKEGFVSLGCGSCAPPGRHYTRSNPLQPQPQSIVWSNSPSFVNGIGAARPQHLNAVPRTPSHMLNALLPLNNHHIGSAPSVNLWDRQHAYPGESPDATVFHPGSLGNMRISGNSPHPLEFVPCNMFRRTGGNCMDVSIPSRSNGLHSPQQRCMIYPARGQMLPVINSFDSPNERPRNCITDGILSQTDNKKQFELDVERIAHGEDKRTTLMIKNIPNKYTSKMLLAAIDECHRGAYDFIYLPIDFKNKCNVGYAFINMTDPSLIVPFYQTFNGKKWEKFNSEKVASLAYARIQGKAALIAHFQNSSLMNEDKRCRPILFHTEGPNADDQVPFPMGSTKTWENSSQQFGGR